MDKLTEANLDRWQSIFQAIPVSTFIWQAIDSDFLLIDVNAAAIKFSGEKINDFIGSKASELYKEDPEILKDLEKCYRTQTGFEREMDYRLRTSSADKVIFVRYSFASPNLILVQVEEITNRKEMEARLTEHNQLLASFIKDSPSALAMVDHEMRYIAASNKWIKDYNLDASQVIGRSHYEIFPEIPQVWRDIHSRCLQGATEKKDEDSFVRLDGSINWNRWEIHPWYKSSGALGGIIMFSEDITARKSLELESKKVMNELIQRNRDLEQFSYIVSHNLRAPVANIMGISDLLLSPELNSMELEELNSGLKNSVLSLDLVIKDLTHILQTKREIHEQKTKVRFSELVDDIKLSIASLIKKEYVSFNTDFSAVEEMLTIKSYIYSIFYNLITNSIKYKQPNIHPIINIYSTLNDGHIIITFKDNGMGIDLEKKGVQIFGLYKRFHFHTEGRGLGLYMVRTQVESLGGKISIESKLNQGTVFQIEFETPVETSR